MSNMETALSQAAILTFEELGFLLPTQEFVHEGTDSTKDGCVCVHFRGTFDGDLLLTLRGGLLPLIAANMLGEEGTPPPAMQEDALRELANVICGNALPLIAGKQEIFHLDAPRPLNAAEEEALLTSALPTATVYIGMDEGRADVSLFLPSNAMVTQP